MTHEYEELTNVAIGGKSMTDEKDEYHIGCQNNKVGRVCNQKTIFGGICRKSIEIFIHIISNIMLDPRTCSLCALIYCHKAEMMTGLVWVWTPRSLARRGSSLNWRGW